MKKTVSTIFAVIMLLSIFTVLSFAAAPKISKTKATVFIGKTVTLKVSGYTGTVKWSSSNKNVATVSSKGVVKGITTGKATITAAAGNKKLTCDVTAKGYNIPSDATKLKGHGYKIFYNSITWAQAKAACEKLGGHLVTITSQAEQDLVYNLRNGSGSFWIGLTDKAKEGSWKWVTGEKLSYTNWDYTPGTDTTSNYAYAGYYAEWYSASSTDTAGYICEWEGNGKTGLSASKASVYYGATKTLKVNYTAASVSWKSSNTKIATVTSKGVVKGIALGTATISAKTAGKTFKCTVTVKDRNVSASASLKCATGGTFIKGINNATATFKLKSYNAAKVTATIVNSDGKAVYKETFSNVKKNTAVSFTWDGKNTKGAYVGADSYRLKVTVGSKNSYSSYLPFKAKSEFAGGDGSKNNPFQIKTIAQFTKIVKYPNAAFKQTANLDFDYNNIGGFFTESQPFNGTYDGGKKSISHITSTNALFNYTSTKSVLKNIIMKSCVVTSTNEEDAMLVRYNSGTIQNCSINANVAISKSGHGYAAVITCENYGKITNCTATGSVSTTTTNNWYNDAWSAGVAAYNAQSGKIISCTSNTTCKAFSDEWDNYAKAAGMVVKNEGSIIDCEAQGTMDAEYSAQLVVINSGNIQSCCYTGTQQINFVRENTGVIV